MHDLALLAAVLILIAVAIPAVAVAERLRIPPVVAFLISGIAVGPHGLGLIGEAGDVTSLAELGVVLLLFEVGLEVSLVKVIKLGWTVLVGGTLQVVLTVAVVAGVAMTTLPANEAVVFGCLVALSSTAVVLQVYRGRRELESPEGKVALGVLLYQDLAVVPLMVIVPLLGGADLSGSAIGILVLKSLGVLVIVIAGGRLVVPRVLDRIVGLKNRDVFTLALALIGLGAAYLTASAGLSLALGAFLAGMVISESEYGAQALSDVLPFRALFSGIFFMSVGMLLDLSFVVERLPMVLGIVVGIVVAKAVIMTLVAAVALRRELVVSIASGMGLAQVGEFSFVVAGVALGAGVLDGPSYQIFLAVAVLSMLATPFLIAAGRPVGRTLASASAAVVPANDDAPPEQPLRGHAIIVGYGMAGRHLASALKAVHLPYRILDVNGRVVREARKLGEPIAFGDGTRREVLEHAGAAEARVVIFTISSPMDELRGAATARALSHSARIMVRTHVVDDVPGLKRLGASDVVVEEFEATLELFQRVLSHYSIPSNIILAQLDALRSEHYGILRGVPKDALHLDDLKYLGIHHALELIEVEEGATAIGESPHSLDLREKTQASVVAVVRQAEPIWKLTDHFRFRAADVVVLVGESPALVMAAEFFRTPDRVGNIG